MMRRHGANIKGRGTTADNDEWAPMWEALERGNERKARKRLNMGAPPLPPGVGKSAWELTWGTEEAIAQGGVSQPPRSS